MSSGSNQPGDMRMLPGGEPTPPVPATVTAITSVSLRQLAELPKDELHALAEEFGLDPTKYRSPQAVVAAIGERRQLIAALDRDAMLDVIRWGRRPVSINATHEQLALEIVKIKAMRFEGLTERGLDALARLRGVDIEPADDVPRVIKKLKKKEGFWTMLNRKRRSWLGSIVSNMLGENEPANEYQFLPPQDGAAGPTATGAVPPIPSSRSIKDEIEESGLFGGIANRVKKSADQYLNQKLDEIEARIDRKLDEIDRRLAEWRDKEIANRLRILKITLWASVIVAVVSLIYSYAKVHFWDTSRPPQQQNVPAQKN